MTKLTGVKIKAICSILLIISFFLPVARGCSGIEVPYSADHKDSDGMEKRPWFILENKHAQTVYAYDTAFGAGMDISGSFMFLFFGYLWPLPFLLFNILVTKRSILNVIIVAELILCAISVYVVTISALFSSKLLSGWYMATIACFIYFCTSAYGILKNAAEYFRRRRV